MLEDGWRGAGLGLMEGSSILGKSSQGVALGSLRGAGACFQAVEVQTDSAHCEISFVLSGWGGLPDEH